MDWESRPQGLRLRLLTVTVVLDDEQSLYITFKGEKLIALSDIHLAGMHNVLNIMAALGICLQLGVSPALAVNIYTVLKLHHIGVWK